MQAKSTKIYNMALSLHVVVWHVNKNYLVAAIGRKQGDLLRRACLYIWRPSAIGFIKKQDKTQ